MLRSHMLKAATGSVFLLGSTLAVSAPQDIKVKTVDIPVWNIITDTLVKMTPVVNGARDDTVMGLVCDLARGEKKQQEVNDILLKNKVDIASLAEKDGALLLLKKSTLAQRQTACAAYLTTSLFTPVNNALYFQSAKSDAKEGAVADNKEITAVKPDTAKTDEVKPDAAKTDANNKSDKVFNQEQFSQDVKIHLAVAQATAQLYAIVANNLDDMKGRSWADYQQKIQTIVTSYAAEYLRSIQMYYAGVATQPVIVRAISDTGYNISDAQGHDLIRNGNSMLLRSLDVDWLGAGKIFGKEYFVSVKIIDADPQGAKTEAKVSKPKPTP